VALHISRIFPRFGGLQKYDKSMVVLLRNPCVKLQERFHHQRSVKQGQTHCQSCKRVKNTQEKNFWVFIKLCRLLIRIVWYIG